MMPVVDEDPMAPSALPTADSYEFLRAYEGSSWNNEVTLRTLELFQGRPSRRRAPESARSAAPQPARSS
jgi:hypothetical protein